MPFSVREQSRSLGAPTIGVRHQNNMGALMTRRHPEEARRRNARLKYIGLIVLAVAVVVLWYMVLSRR